MYEIIVFGCCAVLVFVCVCVSIVHVVAGFWFFLRMWGIINENNTHTHMLLYKWYWWQWNKQHSLACNIDVIQFSLNAFLVRIKFISINVQTHTDPAIHREKEEGICYIYSSTLSNSSLQKPISLIDFWFDFIGWIFGTNKQNKHIRHINTESHTVAHMPCIPYDYNRKTKQQNS